MNRREFLKGGTMAALLTGCRTGLLMAAFAASDPYVRNFLLDQLRWCGYVEPMRGTEAQEPGR